MAAFCLMYVFSEVESSFIKPNNVPRVGRSSESDLFDQGLMGYVIKTIPSKTIPRMGRRNFDSVSFCIFTLQRGIRELLLFDHHPCFESSDTFQYWQHSSRTF